MESKGVATVTLRRCVCVCVCVCYIKSTWIQPRFGKNLLRAIVASTTFHYIYVHEVQVSSSIKLGYSYGTHAHTYKEGFVEALSEQAMSVQLQTPQQPSVKQLVMSHNRLRNSTPTLNSRGSLSKSLVVSGKRNSAFRCLSGSTLFSGPEV